VTKKDFIALGEAFKKTHPGLSTHWTQWLRDRDAVADFLESQYPAFNRKRWIDYIMGGSDD